VGTAHGSLQNAYLKFKAYHAAIAKLDELVKAGSWQGTKPTQGVIKDLFCSRSFYSSHFTKFNKITDYPDLQRWLEDHPDKGTDLEVWGLKKDKYIFSDIDTFVAQKGTLVVPVEESEEEEDNKGKKRKGGKGKKTGEGEKTTGSKKGAKKKSFFFLFFSLIFQLFVLWFWIILLGSVPKTMAMETAMPEHPFPDIPFSTFAQFIQQHFSSNISLPTVLLLLFSLTENPDLLNLHAHQQHPKSSREKRSVGSAWIKTLSQLVKDTCDQRQSKILKKADLRGTEEDVISSLGTKFDLLAKVLGLFPYNDRGQFTGKLLPVSDKRPVFCICPDAYECETASCNS